MSIDGQLTLRKSFFDDLWPLILQKNICDTNSKNTSEYFVPERRFDNLWAHTLLAAKGFKDYQKPIEFCCSRADKDDVQQHTPPEADEEEICFSLRKPHVERIDQQASDLQKVHEHRQKLAYDFANRKFPWYMQRSSFKRQFELNDEIRVEFNDQLEFDVLRNIHIFNCKFMIIDFAANVGIGEMERWLKFCRYVPVIAVVRCQTLVRQIPLLGDAFYAILVEEDLENTWQEELAASLSAGTQYAKVLNIYKNCAKPLVFVFARERTGCTCDTIKILRKF